MCVNPKAEDKIKLIVAGPAKSTVNSSQEVIVYTQEKMQKHSVATTDWLRECLS